MLKIVTRRRKRAGGYRASRNGRGSIAGMERGGVNRRPVGAHRQRPRRVAKQRDDAEHRAIRVERPNIGAANARSGELRIDGRILPSMSGGDKSAVAS